MPIMRTVKGTGEIVPYKWADYIIPFLAIPKEYLKGLDPKVLSLPRTARSFKMDLSVMDFVESDYFRLLIVDIYAFMVRLEITDSVKLQPGKCFFGRILLVLPPITH